ncbi:MAG: alpha/beta fold hydrolase [Phycisphaeraceae bacterium]|nr:alpha/beta fold hydrolase [Phycisphaerae bacterium]MBX3391208.1 alpha/beta fold hydrolase [Phycisphaeraceae bacterium]
MPLPPPVIVVPGITASYLNDEYPVTPEVVWSVVTRRFERIRLHPDKAPRQARPCYEANQPARIVPGQVFEIAYKELIAELRHNLSRREDEPVPVYQFSYDWRMPLNSIQDTLADFVNEVIDRTCLMRHYAEDGYAATPKVNLLGHSMGGLVIAGYLASHAGDAAGRIKDVCTLATPFRGSFEAIVKMLTGTADLGGGSPSSREREAARVMPSLYHLLPSIKGRGWIDIDPDLGDSIFQPEVWQASILDTIREYVRLYAVEPGNKARRSEQADRLIAGLLKAADSHRKTIEKLDLAAVGLKPENWLAVVGIGSRTRVRMAIRKDRSGKPEFVLTSDDRLNHFDPKAPEAKDGAMSGDGTVPFEGAVPGFLAREHLVCVTPADYGYWEWQDRATTQVGGFHGILPNMNLIHRLIIRHFTKSPDPHKNTWGLSAPGVAKADWKPPMSLRHGKP